MDNEACDKVSYFLVNAEIVESQPCNLVCNASSLDPNSSLICLAMLAEYGAALNSQADLVLVESSTNSEP